MEFQGCLTCRLYVVCLVAQSCPTLCNPVDYSPPGSSVHGFSSQEYCSGLTFPSPGDLDPGIKPRSPAFQAYSLPSEPPGKPQDSILDQKKIWTFLVTCWPIYNLVIFSAKFHLNWWFRYKTICINDLVFILKRSMLLYVCKGGICTDTNQTVNFKNLTSISVFRRNDRY